MPGRVFDTRFARTGFGGRRLVPTRRRRTPQQAFADSVKRAVPQQPQSSGSITFPPPVPPGQSGPGGGGETEIGKAIKKAIEKLIDPEGNIRNTIEGIEGKILDLLDGGEAVRSMPTIESGGEAIQRLDNPLLDPGTVPTLGGEITPEVSGLDIADQLLPPNIAGGPGVPGIGAANPTIPTTGVVPELLTAPPAAAPGIEPSLIASAPLTGGGAALAAPGALAAESAGAAGAAGATEALAGGAGAAGLGAAGAAGAAGGGAAGMAGLLKLLAFLI